jgi:hypothetical protein
VYILGCSRFFEFHKEADIKDYAETFGYDTEVLKLTLKQVDGGTDYRRTLSELDRHGVTDFLYNQQKQDKSVYKHDSIQTYILDIKQKISELRKNVYSEEKPEEMYSFEDPYKMINEIIGLIYDISEDNEDSEESEEEVLLKLQSLSNLLKQFLRKKCPRCGNEVESNFCEFCGFFVDEDLDLTKRELEKELLELLNEIQLERNEISLMRI